MVEWIVTNTGGLLCLLAALTVFYFLWLEALRADRENVAKPKPKKRKP